MHKTMCPAPGQITVILCVRRAATSQPGRIAANQFVRRPEKISGSDYIICPANVDVTGSFPQIHLSGGRSKNMSQRHCSARGKYAEILCYLLIQLYIK